ncbi:phytanoyl-CoA dioxygenase family protein [Bordetella bronchialis]|uniref:Phytanoyl-CoA dioxygenase n=1 Tax=Bordetella bronchialis TaxID=463025 RepID=A0A193FXR7_9BORD|nr:phytanoyl-CoA dioxygenase family protein [Bordetella bronchialis]ANN71976.1 phytanoyl-CoA dioxygenase [Bordetella bronchialis]
MSSPLTPAQLAVLREQGFVVARAFLPAARRDALRALATAQLEQAAAPVEYEADLAYPGAPASRQAEGGGTVRRLLDAYARDPLFAAWATDPAVAASLQRYFGQPAVLSRAHHNCVMTKHPRFGSLTGWHRDIRYWSFDREDLVSTWLALGPETAHNGGLWLVPGSHVMDLPAERFDAAQFLREDLPENAALIASAVTPELEPGDVLFFHCRTLHAAGRNQSDQVKFSVVHTYHAADTRPIPGTRSASKPEAALPEVALPEAALPLG